MACIFRIMCIDVSSGLNVLLDWSLAKYSLVALRLVINMCKVGLCESRDSGLLLSELGQAVRLDAASAVAACGRGEVSQPSLLAVALPGVPAVLPRPRPRPSASPPALRLPGPPPGPPAGPPLLATSLAELPILAGIPSLATAPPVPAAPAPRTGLLPA